MVQALTSLMRAAPNCLTGRLHSCRLQLKHPDHSGLGLKATEVGLFFPCLLIVLEKIGIINRAEEFLQNHIPITN